MTVEQHQLHSHEPSHEPGTPHDYPIFCPFQCDGDCIDNSFFIDYGVATFLAGLCIFVSLWHIGKHLKYFTNPQFQAKIIIILCMAPFYCISSIISIYYHVISPYLTVIRDCYEAFLLFTFFYLIFSYLAYDEEKDDICDLKLYKTMIVPENGQVLKLVYHMWPFNYCLKPYKLSSTGKAKYFTYRCKKYVLQCFVLKPVAAILTLILTPFQETNYYASLGLTIIQIVVCISVSYSLYYLLLFYYALKKPLAPYNPLAKFLVIKITLFFTFWQALTLIFFEEQVLECFDQGYMHYNGTKIMVGIENTLICFEMLIMSLVGGPAFTFKEFKNQGEVQRGKFKDVLWNMAVTFKNDFRLIKPKKRGMDNFHDEIELEVKQRLSETSLGAEYKIELYGEDGDDKKFSMGDGKYSQNGNLIVEQSDYVQEGQISKSKQKYKSKRPVTDLNQLLIPNQH